MGLVASIDKEAKLRVIYNSTASGGGADATPLYVLLNQTLAVVEAAASRGTYLTSISEANGSHAVQALRDFDPRKAVHLVTELLRLAERSSKAGGFPLDGTADAALYADMLLRLAKPPRRVQDDFTPSRYGGAPYMS